jgi:antitoxin HicB
MLKYPAKLAKQKEGGYVVTFPDIREAITQGENRNDALVHAKDALETAMDFYFEQRREVPMPSQPRRGQELVELPVSLTAKILLLNEMIRQNVRPAELARRIGTTPQEVNRFTDIRHTTKIDTIALALSALGKTLEIRVV